MIDVDLVDLVAVVNHLGERLLITVDQYHSGQWQLWEEPVSSSTEPEEVVDGPSPDPGPTGSRRKRRRDPGVVDHYIVSL